MSKIWNENDLNKFIELYPVVPTEDLVKMFGRTKSSLVTKAYKLRIKEANKGRWT